MQMLNAFTECVLKALFLASSGIYILGRLPHLRIWDLVLTFNAKEFSESYGVKVVQLPCMTLVDV